MRGLLRYFSSNAGRPSAAFPIGFIAEGFVRDDPAKQGQGEDALFITQKALGVADGVGGWSSWGIDSGNYSRALMQSAFNYVRDYYKQSGHDAGEIDPQKVLEYGYERANQHIGSSTATIVCGGRGNVKAINLGDSGVVHFVAQEDGSYQIGTRSEEQTLGFNFPRQLGTQSDDKPVHGQQMSFVPKPGDLLLLATDGLFDNVFVEDMRKILSSFHFTKCKQFGEKTTKLLEEQGEIKDSEELRQLESACRGELKPALNAIKECSEKISGSESANSPFAVSATAHGKYWTGGKEDDLTVILAAIVPDCEIIANSNDLYTEKRS